MRTVLFWIWLAVFLVGCGSHGKLISTEPGLPPNSGGFQNLVLDEARSTSAIIGPTGGSLSVTGVDGSVFTLSVPANALLAPTEIRLIPLLYVAGTQDPVGVHLLPEGLQFYQPAILTIHPPAGIPVNSLLGFSYTGDGRDLHRHPISRTLDSITFALAHFSGFGAVPNLPTTVGGSSTESTAIDNIAVELASLDAVPATPEALGSVADFLADVIRGWYTSSLRTRLANIPNVLNDQRLVVHGVLNEYTTWRLYASGLALPEGLASLVAQRLAPELAEAADLAAQGLRAQIAAENAQGAAENDLTLAMEAMLWYERARALNLATTARQLDLDTVLSNLCVKVVFVEQEFPASLGEGQSGELRLKVGYQVGDHPPRFDQPMSVEVEAQNGTVTQASGDTVDGFFTTSIQRLSASQELRIDISAHFLHPALLRVFADSFILRGAVAETGNFLGTFRGTHQTQVIPPSGPNDAFSISGPIIIAIQPDYIQLDYYLSDFFFERGTRFAVFREPWTLNGDALTAQGPLTIYQIPSVEVTVTRQGNSVSGVVSSVRWNSTLSAPGP